MNGQLQTIDNRSALRFEATCLVDLDPELGRRTFAEHSPQQ